MQMMPVCIVVSMSTLKSLIHLEMIFVQGER